MFLGKVLGALRAPRRDGRYLWIEEEEERNKGGSADGCEGAFVLVSTW